MKGRVAAFDTVVVTTWFFSTYLIGQLPSALAGWALFILLAGYLSTLWLAFPRTRLRLHLDRASYVALLAGAAYLAVTYEPALIVRSVLIPVSATTLTKTLVYSVVFGVFLQSFLFNLNFRSMFDQRRAGAVVLPFALFLILFVPFTTLQAYVTAPPADLLTFVIVDLFGGTALFVVLLTLYAKSRFDNLPGVVFYFAASIPNVIAFLLAADPVLELFWLFAAFGVAIVLVEFLLPATWVERRLFPAVRQRPTSRSSRRATFAALGGIAAIAVTLFLVLPAVLGTPHPFYADATGSMAPQIEPGSLLIVHHVNLDSITVGDVLVFNAPWSPGLTVAHKVIAVLHPSTGLEFRTRGIANAGPDPIPVPAANVFGIVLLVIPWVGYLILDFYLVLLVTSVTVGAYVAYSVAYPRRSHPRRVRALF